MKHFKYGEIADEHFPLIWGFPVLTKQDFLTAVREVGDFLKVIDVLSTQEQAATVLYENQKDYFWVNPEFHGTLKSNTHHALKDAFNQ